MAEKSMHRPCGFAPGRACMIRSSAAIRQLAVVLAVDFPKKDTDTLYHITTWEIVNTQDWAADTSMKLLRTDTPESET